jgi:CRISPR-associated protein Cas5h
MEVPGLIPGLLNQGSENMKDGIKVYSFDLCGYMAHFRKRYTNASALTYYLPPPTTIMGIVANMLGYQRDTYYEELSSQNLDIAIALKKEARRIIQTINLLKVEDKKVFDHSSQTRTEFLVPQEHHLCYRIWLAPRNKDLKEKLDNIFRHKRYISKGASISLGPAYALGWLDNVATLEGKPTKGDALIYSAIPVQKDLHDKLRMRPNNKTLKEDSFRNFDPIRSPINFMTILYDIAGNPIEIANIDHIKLDSGENIVWLSSTPDDVKNPG